MHIKSKHKGFSLIEVSIALVIIGLLAGAALKGRDLINRARLRAVVDEVSSIKIASELFQDKYGYIPGELLDASVISEDTENGHKGIFSIDDAKRFWSHLSKSNFLHLELINDLISSKVGGVYTVSSNVRDMPGYWLILCSSTSDNQTYNGILTPEDAYYIDKNNDTGEPFSGDIRCLRGADAVQECFVNSKYNLKNKNTDCVIMFRLF